MAVYEYKAKKGPGAAEHGEITADSRTAALVHLDSMGYVPVWVREKAAKRAGWRMRSTRIGRRDVTVFTLQLASLIRSGVPILRALSTIGSQLENLKFRKVVADIEMSITEGKMLSEAMSDYPVLFPNLYVSMVRAGESGGVLDVVLMRLAESREKEDDTTRRIRAAVAYPLLVLSVGVSTVFILLTFFLPRVTGLFKNQDDLPAATEFLMSISDFCAQSWQFMLLGLAVILIIINAVLKRDKGRMVFDEFILNIPVLGRAHRQAEISRFARTLALLTQAGINIEQALKLSAGAMRNTVLRAEVDRVREQTVGQGRTLSSGMAASAHFPGFVSNMMSVGEESGRLDESLIEVADFFDKEVDQSTRLATSLLEPILILAVGGVVAFIVIAMLMPIFDLGSGL